jgi:hypothetical protein
MSAGRPNKILTQLLLLFWLTLSTILGWLTVPLGARCYLGSSGMCLMDVRTQMNQEMGP